MTNRLAFYQFCLAVRRKEALALCLALCTLGLGLCASAKEPRPSFIIFDAPGAGTDAYQGTAPLAVDATGVIVGGYLDENYAWHGFLRAKGGRITTFDPSGAGTGPFQGTQAWSLNPVGEITGLYVDANGMLHGFLRAPNGRFTKLPAWSWVADKPMLDSTCPK
jgi:hypothetical protein